MRKTNVIVLQKRGLDLVRPFFNNICILMHLIYIYISEAGSWITLELWNIPWRDDFLDLNSEAFKNAKFIVEKAVSYLKISNCS